MGTGEHLRRAVSLSFRSIAPLACEPPARINTILRERMEERAPLSAIA